MRIVVSGGGPVAVTLATYLARNEGVEVSVLTRRPNDWSRQLRAVYKWVTYIDGTLAAVSDDPAEIVPGADMVILTVPAFARTEVLTRIKPHLEPEAWVGSFPGVGGFDWVARSILGPTQPVFGLQRIPWLTLPIDYGKSALVTGVRPEVWLGALPRHRAPAVATQLSGYFGFPVRPLDNILVNALSIANPIFHPVRLYSLFQDWEPGHRYPDPVPFYAAWDDRASQYYLACDREIQAACRKIPLDMCEVWPLLEHYGLEGGKGLKQRLTQTIRDLKPLHPVKAPLKPAEDGDGYEINLATRFFTEDFPHGLLALRSVAHLAGIPTPTMDEILAWAEKVMERSWLDEAGEPTGPDVQGLPIPQNYGLDTLEKLVRHAKSER